MYNAASCHHESSKQSDTSTSQNDRNNRSITAERTDMVKEGKIMRFQS